MQQNVPQYQQPADDPQYLALKAQADRDNIEALKNRTQIDSASILARYGSRLTLAAGGGASAAGSSPTMAAPLAPASDSSGLQNLLSAITGKVA